MERKITKIEAIPNIDINSMPKFRNRRVAAYARVSTSSDEQLLSVEAQKDYYPKYIATHPNWEYVGLYADEGVSGVSSKNRDQFNLMIADSVDGKIDLIVTKSISRFGRNTVDTLTAIRKLKEAGVEVYFEKEQIFTFDSKGEFMLTLLSSMAQEESRSLSENVTWGQRKRMADGKYSLPYAMFLGYKKGDDGTPVIVEEEAVIIRRIFRLFLEGMSTCSIAKYLTAEGIPSPAGKGVWQTKTIISILTNEKYYGAALLQKTFTVDYLTKATKINNGELPRYYIENAHEPIIGKAVFDEAQKRFGQTVDSQQTYHAFSNKIVCGDCGNHFGRRITGSYRENKKYRCETWKCINKYQNEKWCRTPHLYKEVLLHLYFSAIQELWQKNPQLQTLIKKEIKAVIGNNKPQASMQSRMRKINSFLAGFPSRPASTIIFGESTWNVVVDRVLVSRDRKLTMRFIDGSEFTYMIPSYSPIKKKNGLANPVELDH